MRERIFGVDFSGAVDAGRKIWIAETIVEDGRLRVTSCRRAADLAGGPARDPAYAALRALVRSAPDAAFGLDFPFGLPRALVDTPDWRAFAADFAGRWPTADSFRGWCAERGGPRELRRRTDHEARVPFAAYNRRLFRQTYHGIRDVLAPLAVDGSAAVLPMDAPLGGAWTRRWAARRG